MIKFCVVVMLSWLSCCLGLSVRHWGENCTDTNECFDPRMLCLPDEDNVLKCLCNKFHKWNDSSGDCMQIYSVAYIMNNTVTVSDNIGKEEKKSEFQFQGPLLSVYFMLFVIASCAFSVIMYCLHIRAKDRRLRAVVNGMEGENLSRRVTLVRREQTRTATSQC